MNLSEFYTDDRFSKILVGAFESKQANTVLDLGVGNGALIHEAFNRWERAAFYVVDLDPHAQLPLFPDTRLSLKFHRTNGLFFNLPRKLGLKDGSIDIAVCNPPFGRIKKRNVFFRIFQKAGLPELWQSHILTTELIFVAQNLRLLRTGGELGLILPASLISGQRFRLFRKLLLERHRVFGIYQLPENVFPKTEALTYILMLQKNVGPSEVVPLYQLSKDGEVKNYLKVETSLLTERMDYKFFVNRQTAHKPTLGMLNPSIKRGRHTQKMCKDSGIPYFHTNSFKLYPNGIAYLEEITEFPNAVMSLPGDILVARVGKRVMGKSALVVSGKKLITDCVFRIRIESEDDRMRAFKALRSKKAFAWLSGISRGVCAKYLTISDILKLPLEFGD